MLYETLLHSQIFLSMLYFGLISGLILEIKLLIERPFKNKYFKIIPDTIYGIVFAFIFIFSMNLLNYGTFRIYLLIAYTLGVILEHKTIGFLVEKIIHFVYTILVKIFIKIKNNKFLSKILKWGNMKNEIFNIIKYTSLIIIFITLIILLCQSIVLINQKQFSNNLKSQINEITLKYEQSQKNQEDLLTNKDYLIDEYLREDLNLIYKNETIINY